MFDLKATLIKGFVLFVNIKHLISTDMAILKIILSLQELHDIH